MANEEDVSTAGFDADTIQRDILEAKSRCASSRTPDPLLDFLDTKNNMTSSEEGWLRSAIFGSDRLKKKLRKDEKDFLMDLLSVAQDEHSEQSFFFVLPYAWGGTKKSLVSFYKKEATSKREGPQSKRDSEESLQSAVASLPATHDELPTIVTPVAEEASTFFSSDLEEAEKAEQQNSMETNGSDEHNDSQLPPPDSRSQAYAPSPPRGGQRSFDESTTQNHDQRDDFGSHNSSRDERCSTTAHGHVSQASQRDVGGTMMTFSTMTQTIVDTQESENQDFLSVTFPDSNGTQRSRLYMRVPLTRKSPSELESGRGVPRVVQKKAGSLSLALNVMDPDNRVLKEAAASKGLIVIKKEQLELSLSEAIALREHCGMSTNSLVKLDQFMRGAKDLPMLPAQLKKSIGRLERECGLPVEVITLPLIVSKNPTKQSVCNFSWVKEPRLVLERLVESCFLAGKFEDSLSFSSLENKLVVVFGGDRGGDSFSMLLRVANREKGNAGRCCQPLCIYEEGSECYENLVATVFSDTAPVKDFLQHLVDDRLHSFVVNVKDLSSGSVLHSRCVVAKILPELEESDWIDNLVRSPDSQEPFDVWAQAITERLFDVEVMLYQSSLGDAIDDGAVETGRLIHLPRGLLEEARDKIKDGHNIPLAVQLLRKEAAETAGDYTEYTGFRLLHETKPVFVFRFKVPLRLPEGACLSFECQQVIGFPAHDTKQGLIISGQGTASDSCSCLICTLLSSLFDRPPEWMRKFDPQNPFLQCEGTAGDAPLREGEYSNLASYERWCEMTGNGKFRLPKNAELQAKQAAFSVKQKPLLVIPYKKDPMAPMHSQQGHVTHVLDNMRGELREIDEDDSDFLDYVNNIYNDAKACQEDSATFKALHKESLKIGHKINALLGELHRELNKKERSQNRASATSASERVARDRRILKLQRQIKNKLEEREAHANRTGYGRACLLSKGAKLVVSLIDNYRKDTSRKSRGEAEFVFNRVIEAIPQVRFRPEHTGFELSNRDGMKVIKPENWEAICDVVCQCYSDQPAKNARVRQVMEKSKAIVKPLYELAVILRTQGRIPPTKQEEMKPCMCHIFAAWREHYSTKSVFLKMHHYLAHVPFFVEWHEMWYRICEEGSEAFHQYLEKVKRRLTSVANTKDRVTLEYSRLQLLMATDVEEILTKVENAVSQAPRGKYKNGGTLRRYESLRCADDTLSEDSDGFVSLHSGELLKKEWMELYYFCQYGRAPERWSNVFDTITTLGPLVKEKVKFSK